MLISDIHELGNRLLEIRKRSGLTQAEVAERADLSDRTYADIERGTANARVETLLRICAALGVTPDSILTRKETASELEEYALLERLHDCAPHEQDTALRLLSVYLDSLI